MNEEKVKACYIIDDDVKAMSCIKDVIKETRTQEGCQPRIVLLTKENCGYCEQTKEHYKEEISSGLITQIDVLSPEGKEIVLRNEIDEVPAVLIVDCHDQAIL